MSSSTVSSLCLMFGREEVFIQGSEECRFEKVAFFYFLLPFTFFSQA